MNLGDNVYKPISFWSWNGDMRESEIRWQINQFKEKGFGGFFIHSRAGRLINYMEDDWFGACAIAIEEAKKIGLDAWLYDEDGWPSGFAGGLVNGCGEEYCAKQLRFCIGPPSDEKARILAVYRQSDNGDYYRIEQEKGIDSDLYCFYLIVSHYVDIMDKSVIAKFIEVTHEVYKKHFGNYFGNVVKGIFTDEPQLPGGPCWSLCLEDKYYEKYQEDILDKLWLMHVNGKENENFRYRFWSSVNELINENFVCQINNWCKNNNLLLTGHFSSEDGLCAQTLSSGGVMPLYENMGIPGIDHLGNRLATSVLMKQVTSVAHQRNVPYVLSESFGCAGWDISFKELLGIAGWQAVFGVNTICTHLSAYTITGRRKRDYPTFFSYQTPSWEDTSVLFDAIHKLNSEIAASKRDTKVAVLHPIRSVWCSTTFEQPLKAKFLTAQFRELVDNLLDVQIDFDLLDEGAITINKDNNSVICAGAVSYSTIIVPESFTLSEKTIQALNAFSKAGGKVIFINGRPKTVEGNGQHPLVKMISEINAIDLQNTRYILQKYFRAYPVQDDFKLFDTRMENDISGIVSYYGKREDGATAYLFNRSSGHDISTIVRHKGKCKIQVVNLTDDSTKDITTSFNGNYTYAPISVEEGTGALLRISYQDDEEQFKNNEVIKTEPIHIEHIIPLADNCLTLDVGRFSVNGGSFSERKAVIHMLDEIYEMIAGNENDSEVVVEYTFDTDFKQTPSKLTLAVEKMDMLEIQLNSKLVTKELGWWIDKGIMKYDISELVVDGINTVLLTYTIPATKEVNNLEGKFESERNRFFYKVEPESIYICGDFDVQCNVTVLNNVSHYTADCMITNQPIFSLVDATQKTQDDITSQGMWFYRGDCEYSGEIIYDGHTEQFVSIDSMHCISARIYVNGMYAGMIICNSDEVNITKHLNKGVNKIVVIAVGHNRNLFGPHHHMRGDLHFVGQHTFMGIREFEDFVNPEVLDAKTWTDSYSFVPFGIGRIVVKSLEK